MERYWQFSHLHEDKDEDEDEDDFVHDESDEGDDKSMRHLFNPDIGGQDLPSHINPNHLQVPELLTMARYGMARYSMVWHESCRMTSYGMLMNLT